MAHHAMVIGSGITALGNGGAMTAMAMTAGGSGMTLLPLNTWSTAKTIIGNAQAATLHGTGMTADSNTGSMTAMATVAGISGILISMKGHSSTDRTTIKIARSAKTLMRDGITATASGWRKTARATMAGGLGIRRAAGTASSAGSPSTNGSYGAKATTEQNYFATVHLAAESTCASYLASAIRPSAERMPGGAIFIL